MLYHGGGCHFHYKGIYRRVVGMGYTFKASKNMDGHTFHLENISMGYQFYQNCI